MSIGGSPERVIYFRLLSSASYSAPPTARMSALTTSIKLLCRVLFISPSLTSFFLILSLPLLPISLLLSSVLCLYHSLFVCPLPPSLATLFIYILYFLNLFLLCSLHPTLPYYFASLFSYLPLSLTLLPPHSSYLLRYLLSVFLFPPSFRQPALAITTSQP